MLKLESIQENETFKILWDLEIQADHQILVRRLYLVLKKRTCHLVDSVVPAIQRVKMKETEKIDK